MMTTDSEPAPPLAGWPEVCARFEALIETWLSETAVPTPLAEEQEADTLKRQKEWASQLASVSMAAQRVIGLRMALIDFEGKEEDSHAESSDPAEQSHWKAIEKESAASDAE